MLFIIQFPLADSRYFLPEASVLPPLKVPSWPLPAPNTEFLRAFGPIRRRWRGGVSGWLGEGVICHAAHAISFSGKEFYYEIGDQAHDPFAEERVQFWIAFRRFFTDGLGLCKFEIGIIIDTKWFWDSISEEHSIRLLKKILNLEVIIPDPTSQGDWTCRLFEAGKGLSHLYLWSSSKLQNFSVDNVQPWWIHPCEPLIYLTQDGWDEKLTISGDKAAIKSDGNVIGSLSHRLISHLGNTYRLWNFNEEALQGAADPHRPNYYRSESQIKARLLRLFLMRLHAEKQCLFQIIRHISRGYIQPTRGTPASERLQHYLNQSIQHISKLRKHGASLTEMEGESLAKDLEEKITAGEYESLLQALANLEIRPNILFKTKKEFGLNVDRADLRKRLSNSLSLQEVNVMCFDLNVDVDNLSPTKSERIIELIQHLENRNELHAMIDWLQMNREDVFTP